MEGRHSDTAAGGSVDLYGNTKDKSNSTSDNDSGNLYRQERQAGIKLFADSQQLPALPRAEADATYTVRAEQPRDHRREDGQAQSADKSADKSDPSFLSKIAANTWLQINGASYHFDRGRGFNERNYGLGVMYRISEDKAVAVGEYKNSIYKTSHYAYFDYEPLKMGPVRAGVLGGVVDGYYFNNGGPIPMLAPTASIEGKHLGVSAFYIPPMKNVSSVVGFQARVKFW